MIEETYTLFEERYFLFKLDMDGDGELFSSNASLENSSTKWLSLFNLP